ncbi:flagellar motor protein [Oceanicola granulosus HTCC2516]|uniref:Flagellar motor protein n=1 Tax=Oceanicola granulosus (strain ATCC BAA-861 / DSM 15982 / KCTC 12143 / HTCC2516) TaxID=314256 RepID=Q2CGF2_OCEGH|nr:hypothetical protein [Oceanicola granulosus]EAR51766.1 flagellar motor protein [Oceanicola granulosus HTCC2516]
MNRLGAFLHLIDETEMRGLVAGWPEEMNVALCVSRHLCAPFIYHASEAGEVLGRAADRLGLPLGGFAATHETKAAPLRKLLFSEEQELHRLVREHPGLVERARDYAINFGFAREEGLDPEAVTREGVPGAGAGGWILDVGPAPAPTDAAPEPAPRPIEGFRPVRREDDEALLVDVAIERGEGGLSVGHGPLAEQAPHVVEPGSLSVRQDFGCLFIPRDAHGDLGAAPQAFCLWIPDEALPGCLLEMIGDDDWTGRCALTSEGLYITPLAARAPLPLPPPARRRLPLPARNLALLVTTFLCSIAVGAALQAGLAGGEAPPMVAEIVR